MAFETKELKGALFVNENKEREQQPDYTGNIKIKGKVWRLAGWKTESRGGVEYISLSISDPDDFKPREQTQQGSAPRRTMTDEEFQKERARRNQTYERRPPPQEYDDDDIPF